MKGKGMKVKNMIAVLGLTLAPIPALAVTLEQEQEEFLVDTPQLKAEQEQFLAKPKFQRQRWQRAIAYRENYNYTPPKAETPPSIPLAEPLYQAPRPLRYHPAPPKPLADIKKPEGYSRVQKMSFVKHQNFIPQPMKQMIEHLIYPLINPVEITSKFGWRTHPISGAQKFHAGTDFGAGHGAPVLSAFSGFVAFAGSMGGYGETVIIQSGPDVRALYAHLSDFYVTPGQNIPQGTAIARVGSTGYSTGPHLHMEVQQLRGGSWVAMDVGHDIAIAAQNLRVFLSRKG